MKFCITKICVVFCLLAILAPQSLAQEIHIRDSIKAYNNKRIRINYIGSMALGTWGVANVVYGGIGSLQHTGTDVCSYQVTTAFGVLNTGISIFRYMELTTQLQHRDSYKATMGWYKSDKIFYLTSLVSDLVITGGGLLLLSNSRASSMDLLQNTGAARAICVQGLVRLLLDNVLWSAHFHNNSKWYDIIADMQYMGNGISFRYPIGGRGRADNSHLVGEEIPSLKACPAVGAGGD